MVIPDSLIPKEDWDISLKNRENGLMIFFHEYGAMFCLEVIGIILLIVVGILYNIPTEAIGYLVSITILIDLLVDWFVYKKYQDELSLSADDFVENDEEDKKYQEVKEKEDFFVLWAHQIKTPIAALNLLFQSDELNISTCKQELFQIENYVELALSYLRFEGMSNDLVLSRYNLDKIVKAVVKKFATVFIHKHLSVDLQGLDIDILTDDKWLSLVLEQVISNSLKYTKEGGICIWAVEDESVEIHIKDTGIGIREEDLPRIFEKGFTGYNGRADKKASGIGLYLAKGICDKLGHEIKIYSKINEGTEVIICLRKEKINNADLTKM